jgi:hypothetical protein
MGLMITSSTDQSAQPATITQADARAALDRLGVFERLAAFDPRWVGSIPLDVHGPGADADICCQGGELSLFKSVLEAEFGHIADCSVSDNTHAGERSMIGRFTFEGLPIEIYGRARPVEAHESYIHWLAEDRLLRLADEGLRTAVRAAKAAGLKTEPAFAHCLKLGGDPYVELLKLASPSDAALREIIRAAGYRALPQ